MQQGPTKKKYLEKVFVPFIRFLVVKLIGLLPSVEKEDHSQVSQVPSPLLVIILDDLLLT